MTLTVEEFGACFDRFSNDVFRLEALQQYTVAEEAPRVEAFARGEPRPERSVRTSDWLARIARTVTVQGKTWRRLHAVTLPLSRYLRYQLVGYVESQACGEQVRLLNNTTDPYQLDGIEDFWLFDADTGKPYAVAMDYDDQGHWLGAELVDDPDQIDRYRSIRDRLWDESVALNEFLASVPEANYARSA